MLLLQYAQCLERPRKLVVVIERKCDAGSVSVGPWLTVTAGGMEAASGGTVRAAAEGRAPATANASVATDRAITVRIAKDRLPGAIILR